MYAEGREAHDKNTKGGVMKKGLKVGDRVYVLGVDMDCKQVISRVIFQGYVKPNEYGLDCLIYDLGISTMCSSEELYWTVEELKKETAYDGE